ncbi:MAG: hypothetical protein JWO15_3572 [Sphingomonadales bacterium]|nr:hypothetical protein [Sphingomonadales bacterium]
MKVLMSIEVEMHDQAEAMQIHDLQNLIQTKLDEIDSSNDGSLIPGVLEVNLLPVFSIELD